MTRVFFDSICRVGKISFFAHAVRFAFATKLFKLREEPAPYGASCTPYGCLTVRLVYNRGLDQCNYGMQLIYLFFLSVA